MMITMMIMIMMIVIMAAINIIYDVTSISIVDNVSVITKWGLLPAELTCSRKYSLLCVMLLCVTLYLFYCVYCYFMLLCLYILLCVLLLCVTVYIIYCVNNLNKQKNKQTNRWNHCTNSRRCCFRDLWQVFVSFLNLIWCMWLFVVRRRLRFETVVRWD